MEGVKSLVESFRKKDCSDGPISSLEYPGAVYHVMNRGLARQPVFRDPTDYETFPQVLSDPHVLCFLISPHLRTRLRHRSESTFRGRLFESFDKAQDRLREFPRHRIRDSGEVSRRPYIILWSYLW